MTAPADEVLATTTVDHPIERAFALFTENIDKWWNRGGDERDTVMRFTSQGIDAISPEETRQVARVTSWQPPTRIALDWTGPHSRRGDRVIIDFADKGAAQTIVTVRYQRPGLTPTATVAAIVGLWWADQLRALQAIPA